MRRTHFCICVRSQLDKPKRQLVRDFKGAIKDGKGGHLETYEQIRSFWMDHLAQGHEVLPMSADCEGFDYKTGCPGHEIEDEAKGAKS
jgi:hypothetical protein